MTTRISLPDHYEIEDVLGQGRLSIVLRARDLRTDRAVAVKTLRPVGWLGMSEVAARNERSEEGLRPLIGLRHPNLAAVHEVCTHEDTFFLARDLAGGTSLRTLLRQRGPLSLYEARWMASQVADGIDALGDAGFPHGALTPDNVFVENNGLVRITDAGFSRTAGALSLAGVACQMTAPVAPTDDVAALAALTFNMLTGHWPFRSDGKIAQAYSAPPAAREALHRALVGGRKEFRSAAAFTDALLPNAEPRPTLFRLVWQPAAAMGLFGALATIGGHAVSEEPGAKAVPPASSVKIAAAIPAQVKEEAAPNTLSEEDRQAVALAIRRQGLAALTHPAIADIFRLTRQQRIDIMDCLVEQRARVAEIVSAAADGPTGEVGTAMQTLRESTNVRILMILDDAQREQWQAFASAPLAPGQPVL